MERAKKPWRQILQGYLGAWTIGIFFCLIVLLLRLLGRIKIKGQKRLLLAAKKGSLAVMSSHPSLIEGFLLPAILAPRYLFDIQLLFWCMPDRNLFLSKSNLISKLRIGLFKLGRCIVISRSEGQNYQQIKQLYRILGCGENVVIHPEGGRTMKGTCFVQLDGRRVRRIESNAATLVARVNGFIIPVFVEKKEELVSVTSSIIGLLTGQQAPMTIHIGEPYRPDHKKSSTELNRELEQKILKAGLS